MVRHRKSGGTFGVPLKLIEKEQAKKRSNSAAKNEQQLQVFDDAETDQVAEDDDDDDEDEEIFDLGMGSDVDDDEDKDGDEDDDEVDSDDDGESDEYDDIGDEHMKNLLQNLPPSLRQKALMGGAQDESSEDEEELEEETEKGWGSKKAYWSADTTDLEIGQDVQDAEDEEAAAKEIHMNKMSRMKESDFFVDFGEEGSTDRSAGPSKSGRSKLQLRDKVTMDLEQLALGTQANSEGVQVEVLTRDTANMTREQKLAMISAQSPELLSLVEELKDVVHELDHKINPIKTLVTEACKSSADVDDDLVDYLEAKQQLLYSYCVNMTFYLYMKASGKSVRSHPVMKQLLELRYIIEKMRAMDGKLKYQVDRLLKLSTQVAEGNGPSTDEVRAAMLRPDPSALMGDDEDDEEEEEDDDGEEDDDDDGDDHDGEEEDDEDLDGEDDDERDGDGDQGEDLSGSEIEDDMDEDSGRGKDYRAAASGTKLYKAPRLASVPYQESETQQEKKEQKLASKRKKLKNSEILEALRDEFGSAPEAASSSGMVALNKEQARAAEDAEERRRHEEERFVRLTLSKKDKKAMKKLGKVSNMNNLDDIGDIGEFEELAELSKGSGSTAASLASAFGLKGQGGASEGDALQKAVSAFVQSSKGKGAGRKEQTSDDALPAPPERKPKRQTAATVDSSLLYGADELRSHARDADDGGMDGDYDDEGDYNAMLKGGGRGGSDRKRRKAPDERMNDEDDDDGPNLLEAFAKKKKEFLKRKEEHYTAEPRYGGVEESLPESGKRGVTYEIMKNKGLTPHRSKLNRNPRVKKREQHRKAVVARKGQVRDVVGGSGAYGGELTGIKANIARSRKLEA